MGGALRRECMGYSPVAVSPRLLDWEYTWPYFLRDRKVDGRDISPQECLDRIEIFEREQAKR